MSTQRRGNGGGKPPPEPQKSKIEELPKNKPKQLQLLKPSTRPIENLPSRRKARDEFRYNNKTGHPNYIFEEEGNKYHSLGITHSKKTFGKNNMPLKSSPNKSNPEKTYIRNGIVTDKKRNYSKRTMRNMEFEKSDKAAVKAKIRNYKKRRKRRKKRTGS